MTIRVKPIFTVKVFVKEQPWMSIDHSSDEGGKSVDLFGLHLAFGAALQRG